MKYVIYKVVNKVNNKIYIGQTINFNNRKMSHIATAFRKKNRYKDYSVFHLAIKKYGIEQFDWSIIWQGDQELLNEMEIYNTKRF